MNYYIGNFEFYWKGVNLVATDVDYYSGSPGNICYDEEPEVQFGGVYLECDKEFKLNIMCIVDEKNYCEIYGKLYNDVVNYMNESDGYEEDYV